MPIYEYQAREEGKGCPVCKDKFQALQSISEEALNVCPSCGTSIRRLISRSNINTIPAFSAERAAQQGFTTFKRSGEGSWEKVAGQGVDAIVGSEADKAAVQAETKSAKVWNLDSD
jgi:putative FmdB family regulatory protein